MSDDHKHDQPLNPEDVLPFDQDAADDSVESKGPVALDQFLYDGELAAAVALSKKIAIAGYRFISPPNA